MPQSIPIKIRLVAQCLEGADTVSCSRYYYYLFRYGKLPITKSLKRDTQHEGYSERGGGKRKGNKKVLRRPLVLRLDWDGYKAGKQDAGTMVALKCYWFYLLSSNLDKYSYGSLQWPPVLLKLRQ